MSLRGQRANRMPSSEGPRWLTKLTHQVYAKVSSVFIHSIYKRVLLKNQARVLCQSIH
jgi:hypothetical protein